MKNSQFIELTTFDMDGKLKVMVRKDQVAAFSRAAITALHKDGTLIFLTNSAGYRVLVYESFEEVKRLILGLPTGFAG